MEEHINDSASGPWQTSHLSSNDCDIEISEIKNKVDLKQDKESK